MKTIIFSLFIFLGMDSYSQDTIVDSARVHQLEVEIKNYKDEFWKILATSGIAHFNGFSGFIGSGSIKDPDVFGPLMLFGSIGLALDIAAVINLCHIPKKKKELKTLGK